MEALHTEVFRMLFAIGWIDGELCESESSVILTAARAEGLDPEQLTLLEACIPRPVEFGEIDQAALDGDSRLYVYAVSSWIARADGRVTTDEQAALHAIATVCGVTGRGREAIDDVVESLEGVEFDPRSLRNAIGAKVAELKADG